MEQLERVLRDLHQGMLLGREDSYKAFTKLAAALAVNLYKSGGMPDAEAEAWALHLPESSASAFVEEVRAATTPNFVQWLLHRLNSRLREWQGRVRKTLHGAARLQSSLMPGQAGAYAGLEVAIGSRPKAGLTGDLHLLTDLGENGLVAVVGDVKSHGSEAGIYSVLILHDLKDAVRNERRPADVLRRLNDLLLNIGPGATHVAMTVAHWQPQARMLTVATAGGPAPILSQGDQVTCPRLSGHLLGLLDAPEFDEASFPFGEGDMAVLFSDGIPDQDNPAGVRLGEERLTGILATAAHLSPPDMLGNTLAALDQFAGGHPQFDDQTLAILRVPSSS